jgi:hypothetical protein
MKYRSQEKWDPNVCRYGQIYVHMDPKETSWIPMQCHKDLEAWYMDPNARHPLEVVGPTSLQAIR